MKREIALLVAILTVSITGMSCISGGGGIAPSDNYITRNYKVTEFDKVDISTVANIYYTQSEDGTTSLEIYGPDNIIELMEVAIAENTLLLSMKKKNIGNIKGMKVMISTPHLDSFITRGVGNAYIENGLTTQSLRVVNEGVGNIKFQSLACQSLDVSSIGVGNLELIGKCKSASLSSKGVGNLKAERLECEQLDVTSEGVGNITCHASESLSATTRGIGNIRYAGNPKEKRLNKMGIGSIKQL